jgi:hypothetical protein
LITAWIAAMKLILGLSVLALVVSSAVASAEPVHWSTYSIPETGTSVDIPVSIFSREAGHPNGYGEKLKTSDGRAELTVLSARNRDNDTPATFLAKLHPPTDIQYKRITPRFVVVSGYKRDMVYYSRCNFSPGLIHCVMLNYPASEERDWDGIVTRISLSLNGKS